MPRRYSEAMTREKHGPSTNHCITMKHVQSGSPVLEDCAFTPYWMILESKEATHRNLGCWYSQHEGRRFELEVPEQECSRGFRSRQVSWICNASTRLQGTKTIQISFISRTTAGCIGVMMEERTGRTSEQPPFEVRLPDGSWRQRPEEDLRGPLEEPARFSPKGRFAAWTSDNAGKEWYALRRGFPEVWTYGVLREGMWRTDRIPCGLYVGTSAGQYASRNHGNNWTPIADGLPTILSVAVAAV